jgi:FAD/FMN-containing dehydrogenase
MDPRSIFPVETYERLQRARARYDPTGMFLANHSISPSE